MSGSVGKIQIVLKGGKPWGFHLKSYSENRSAVVIDHIESGGKAEIDGGLKVGDHVIKINDVLCLSLADTLQLIDSAFRTLTVLVWRPGSCYQDDTRINNFDTELEMHIYDNIPLSPPVQQLHGPYFQKFPNLKYNVTAPKINEKLTSYSSDYENTDSGNSLQYNTSNCSEASLPVCVQTHSKSSTAHKLSVTLKDSVNKHYNEKATSNQESFKPLLIQSHQSANLQYICEQYPLSEFFFSQKSDLKLESLATHPKKHSKKYQCIETYEKPLGNIIDNRSASNTIKEMHISRTADPVCCMYRKCHNSNENCKRHSSPQRGVTEIQPNIVEYSTRNFYTNNNQNFNEIYEPHLATSSKLSDNHLFKKNLNHPLYKESFKIKENGFKNSDLKIFKPIEILAESKALSSNSCNLKQSKNNESFCQEQVSLLLPKYNIYPSSFKHENKGYQNLSNKTNDTSAQNLSNELNPDSSTECLLSKKSEIYFREQNPFSSPKSITCASSYKDRNEEHQNSCGKIIDTSNKLIPDSSVECLQSKNNESFSQEQISLLSHKYNIYPSSFKHENKGYQNLSNKTKDTSSQNLSNELNADSSVECLLLKKNELYFQEQNPSSLPKSITCASSYKDRNEELQNFCDKIIDTSVQNTSNKLIPDSSEECLKSKSNESFCQEQISLLSPKYNIYPSSFKHENKGYQNLSNKTNDTLAQDLSNELNPDSSIECLLSKKSELYFQEQNPLSLPKSITCASSYKDRNEEHKNSCGKIIDTSNKLIPDSSVECLQSKNNESFSQEQISLLSHKYNIYPSSFKHENKGYQNLSNKTNDTSDQDLSNELNHNSSVESLLSKKSELYFQEQNPLSHKSITCTSSYKDRNEEHQNSCGKIIDTSNKLIPDSSVECLQSKNNESFSQEQISLLTHKYTISPSSFKNENKGYQNLSNKTNDTSDQDLSNELNHNSSVESLLSKKSQLYFQEQNPLSHKSITCTSSYKDRNEELQNFCSKIDTTFQDTSNELILDSPIECLQSKNNESFCQEQISLLSPKYNICTSSFKHENKCYQNLSNKTNDTSAQDLCNELISSASVESLVQVNNSREDKTNILNQNALQNVFFETLKQQSDYSDTSKYQNSLLEEQAMCGGSDNCLVISSKAEMTNIFASELLKSDGDEDDELCFIEENVKNSCSSFALKYSPITPDTLSLPPLHLNDETQNVSDDEHLPSPLSFSPVKEVIYENVAVKKKPQEAIYANLEMLKIQCSFVKSSTQANALEKSSKNCNVETKHLSKQSFSFVETEIFSNITGPTFGKEYRKDYLKNFLQSRMETYSSILKETIKKAEKSISIARQAASLPVASAYFTTSVPKAKLLTRYVSSLQDEDSIGDELANKKEELMSSINKKLGILRLEQVALREEMKQNDELGSLLMRKLMKYAQPNEVEKFKTHVEELEKITYLIISLSGRLARAENALLILPPDAQLEEKSTLENKYSKLYEQYEEAKSLKKIIDRRNYQVLMFLRRYFSEEEFADYDHFITMKAKLLVDCREVDEKIKLGEEQLSALKSSHNNQGSHPSRC